jgi:hypothetical protein
VGESKEDKFAGPEMLLVKDEGVNENGERLLDDLVRLSTTSTIFVHQLPFLVPSMRTHKLPRF